MVRWHIACQFKRGSLIPKSTCKGIPYVGFNSKGDTS